MLLTVVNGSTKQTPRLLQKLATDLSCFGKELASFGELFL